MSGGVLRGLAERALGVAQPLRSRQALRAASVPHDDPAGEAAPLPPVQDAVTLPSTATAAVASSVPAQSASPILESSASAGTARPEAVIAHVQAERADTPPLGVVRPVVFQAVMPAVLVRDHLAVTDTETPPHPGPRSASASTPDPAPLLPAQPVAWPMHRMPTANAAASESAAASIGRRTTAEHPTEVHVSIGRVELIAHPPASTPRPVARSREGTRSLTDYLSVGRKG